MWDEWREKFEAALCDDLNTPNALTIVYKTVKEINVALRTNPLDVNRLEVLFYSLSKMIEILGLQFDYPLVNDEDRLNYELYMKARNDKDFEKADMYRKVLIERNLL